jgi:AcrR family transcriptional regulator
MVSAVSLSRRVEERQRHREEILKVALRLFAGKGYHNVSMHEIAAAARFATGTLYNFFANKEDLFTQLLVSQAEAGLGALLPILDGPGDERQRLSAYIRGHEQTVREHGDAIRLYLMVTRGRFPDGLKIEARKKEIDARIVVRLAEVIRAGIRKGLFNRVDPKMAARCLSAVLQAISWSAAENGATANLAAEFDKLEAVIFQGLVKSPGGHRDN